MATSIDTFKRNYEYIAKKSQIGNTLTIPQFNEMAHAAQMLVYEKDRAVFISQGEASDYLKSFLKTKTYSSNNIFGEFDMPNDLEHIVGVRSFYVKSDGIGVEVPLSEVKSSDWGVVSSSSLFAATKRFPKYAEFGGTVKYLPRDLTNITVDYFKTPIKPVWAYATVNGRPVYSAANSINFEWDEFAINQVMGAFLSFVGVNLKDAELSNFAQIFKQESNSIV
jgi:hypothetical protein